jgi:hypothetical protein
MPELTLKNEQTPRKGRPPEVDGKTYRLTIALDELTYNKLETAAKADHRKTAAMARLLIEKGLEEGK